MILKAEHLIKKYKSRTVVKDVSVQVEQGEIVGLLGPNGAGKTTSFYMIVGLITPNGGRIFLDDQEITKEPVYKRAQLGVGYLAQEASVFRRLSVEDNIRAVLEMTKMTKEEQKDRLEEMLDEFGLQHIRKSLGIQLSGGERRRTEIARALSIRPKFILLDEPFAGVDPIAVEDIQNIVQKLKDKNIGILITDHRKHFRSPTGPICFTTAVSCKPEQQSIWLPTRRYGEYIWGKILNCAAKNNLRLKHRIIPVPEQGPE